MEEIITIEFTDHKTSNTIIEVEIGPIPRKGERVFLEGELYKVKRVFHWYELINGSMRLKNVEVSLKKL